MEAVAGQEFDAVLEGAPSDLVGTIGVRIMDAPAATTVVDRATAGIVESIVGSGIYAVTLTAPETAGEYLILWDVVDGGEPLTPDAVFTEDLRVFASVVPGDPSITPTVAEVAAILRARTRQDDEGEELGTFGADTRPTGGQVSEYIAQAVGEITLRVHVDVPERWWPNARRLAAIRAAMFVELSYEPDNIEQADSAYGRLKELWDEGMRALLGAIEGGTDSGRMVSVQLASPYGGGPFDGEPELLF